MTTVIFTSASGDVTEIDAPAGSSVMEAAVRNGVKGIVAECGGTLSCATCHVFVDESEADMFPPVSELEDEMLEGTAEDREECSRLSCQLRIVDGMPDVHVSLPESQV